MNTPAETPGERSIFLSALEVPPEERTAYVLHACGDNAALCARVMSLLRAFKEVGQFLAEPAAQQQVDLHLGTTIGPYTLVERLGEGGFGLVYAAEQTTPIRRTVALKILKLGVSSEQVVARFNAERHALSMMDHPGIAKVLDGGTTESGRPYFVMELVRGVPITDYCDQRRLSAADRARLVMGICAALHHAHQKGVIHRDIKPSNVLVVEHDGVPAVKVIDFGVAKAISPESGDWSVRTEVRQLIGTPAYMSPEQAAGGGTDVDIRADIYAMGVLLYELLAGATPLDSDRLLRAGVAEVERLIREEEPPRPSDRLTSLGASATAVASARSADVRQLQRNLRGDLDWIVMKAISKERDRRYDSAAAFAEDLQRFLEHQPVQAGPPTAVYRVGKFVRRHRVGVTAGCAVAASLVIGLVLTANAYVQAAHDRDVAVQARAAEQVANAAAEARRRDAFRNAERDRVRSDFIGWGFGIGNPSPEADGSGSMTIRRLLDLAGSTVDTAYADSPSRRAQAHAQLGSLYHSILQNEPAREHLQTAVDLWQQQAAVDASGTDVESMAAALVELLEVHIDLNASPRVIENLQVQVARANVRTLQQRVAAAGLGQPASEQAIVAAVDMLLDSPWPGAAKLDQTMAAAQAALDDPLFACGSPELDHAGNALLTAMYAAGTRWADSALFERFISLCEQLHQRCPRLMHESRACAMLLFWSADAAVAWGLHPEAIRLCDLAKECLPRFLPPGHKLLPTLDALALYARMKSGDQSVEVQQALQANARVLQCVGSEELWSIGAVVRLLEHGSKGRQKGVLAQCQSTISPLAEPIEAFVDAMDHGTWAQRLAAAKTLTEALQRAPRGAEDPRPLALAGLSRWWVAYADGASGQRAESVVRLLDALVDLSPEQVRFRPGAAALALWWLSWTHQRLGNAEQAVMAAERSIRVREEYLLPTSTDVLNGRRVLGRALLERGDVVPGCTQLVQTYWDMRRVSESGNSVTAAAVVDAAIALVRAGSSADAGALLEQHARHMLQGVEEGGPLRAPKAIHCTYVGWQLAVIDGLDAHAYQTAERLLRLGLAGQPTDSLRALALGIAQYRQGKLEEAEKSFQLVDTLTAKAKVSPHPTAALFLSAVWRQRGNVAKATELLATADARAQGFSFEMRITRPWAQLRAELGGAPTPQPLATP